MAREEDRLVYSSDQPLPLARTHGKSQSPSPRPGMPDDGILRVARERRRGGVVTLVTGLGAGELDGVARILKRRCGGGGTTKDGILTLQGDHRDMIVAYFEAEGRRCKRAGG